MTTPMLVVLVLVVVLVVCIILYTSSCNQKSARKAHGINLETYEKMAVPSTNAYGVKTPFPEMPVPPVEDTTQFTVYNYTRANIAVEVVSPSGKKEKFASVKSQDSASVNARIARSILKRGSKIEIYLVNVSKSSSTLYATYDVVKDGMQALHVGMVTMRTNPNGNYDHVIGNVQGMPRLYVHNTTLLPLNFENPLCVQPESVVKYTGRDHNGVPLGLLLEEESGLYPSITVRKPVTDIYFGVVSDLQQPMYGGWDGVTARVPGSDIYSAFPFKPLDDDPTEVAFPLQDGYF